MLTHIRLLGVLYLVWGSLGILLGVAMLLLGAGAAAVARSPIHEGTEFAAGATALLLILVGLLLLAGGAVNAWAGAALGRRRSLARLVGLALALVNLFLFPAGTALGSYSFYVLLHNETRRIFEGEV